MKAVNVSSKGMWLRLSQVQFEFIRQHGVREYPSECCGVLLGRANGELKQVTDVEALQNLRHDVSRAQQLLPVDDPARETERNRFLIDPLEQLRVEKSARARGLEVLGYYHSHPDHPARPSIYDREHAWPRYSYVIVSVERGIGKDLTCWVLPEDGGMFCPEQVEVVE
jgi:proteasome lid subunit RPN8/RPN11